MIVYPTCGDELPCSAVSSGFSNLNPAAFSGEALFMFMAGDGGDRSRALNGCSLKANRLVYGNVAGLSPATSHFIVSKEETNGHGGRNEPDRPTAVHQTGNKWFEPSLMTAAPHVSEERGVDATPTILANHSFTAGVSCNSYSQFAVSTPRLLFLSHLLRAGVDEQGQSEASNASPATLCRGMCQVVSKHSSETVKAHYRQWGRATTRSFIFPCTPEEIVVNNRVNNCLEAKLPYPA